MPIYRVLWPVYHNGKRHMPNEALNLPESAGKRLAKFRAVVDPDAPPSNPTTPTMPTTPTQQPAEPAPRGGFAATKVVAQSKTEAKKKTK